MNQLHKMIYLQIKHAHLSSSVYIYLLENQISQQTALLSKIISMNQSIHFTVLDWSKYLN